MSLSFQVKGVYAETHLKFGFLTLRNLLGLRDRNLPRIIIWDQFRSLNLELSQSQNVFRYKEKIYSDILSTVINDVTSLVPVVPDCKVIVLIPLLIY